MRAFRPSRFGQRDEREDVQQFKQAKVVVYADRAREGLPLFELTIQRDTQALPPNVMPQT